MNNIYIYGAGGHGKVVLDAMTSIQLECSGFVDDKPITQWASLSVIKIEQLTVGDQVHIAIGNSMIRESIVNINKLDYISIFHAKSIIANNVTISPTGTFLAANSVVGPDAIIGSHCIINHGAVVDHDCRVGDYCHIAPNAVLGGGVSIGRHVLVGAGAVVLPGISITDNVIIGAGAVVTQDVYNEGTLVGMPATFLKK